MRNLSSLAADGNSGCFVSAEYASGAGFVKGVNYTSAHELSFARIDCYEPKLRGFCYLSGFHVTDGAFVSNPTILLSIEHFDGERLVAVTEYLCRSEEWILDGPSMKVEVRGRKAQKTSNSLCDAFEDRTLVSTLVPLSQVSGGIDN
jgi:hypothetical protein